MSSDSNGGLHTGVISRSIPSVQTKVSEKAGEETRNILQYVWVGFLFGFAGAFIAYSAVNVAITGDDWYPFVHIAFMLIPTSALYIFTCMVWWRRGWIWHDTIWTYMLLLVFYGFLFLFLVFATTEFWIWIWKWRGLGDGEWIEGLMIFSLVVALPFAATIAGMPMIIRVIREVL